MRIINIVFLFFASICSCSFSASNNFQGCSEIQLVESKNSGSSWEASLELGGISGKVSYIESEERLFLRVPDFYRGPKHTGPSMFSDYPSAIECLVSRSLSFVGKDVRSVVVDTFSLGHLCSAIDRYLGLNKTPDVDWFPQSLLESKDSRRDVVQSLENIGFYEDWRKAFNEAGYSVISINSSWLEKYSLIDGAEFLSMYGPDGKVINNFCGYSRSKYVAISERYNETMFPHYIGLHGFEISQMKKAK